MYAAIGLFLVAFVFPESVNHAYLETITSVLDKAKALVAFQSKLLTFNMDAYDERKATLDGLRVAMFQTYRGCKSHREQWHSHV